MSIDAPPGANFNDEDDDEWLYGEAHANEDNSSSRQLTGALAESKVSYSTFLLLQGIQSLNNGFQQLEPI